MGTKVSGFSAKKVSEQEVWAERDAKYWHRKHAEAPSKKQTTAARLYSYGSKKGGK